MESHPKGKIESDPKKTVIRGALEDAVAKHWCIDGRLLEILALLIYGAQRVVLLGSPDFRIDDMDSSLRSDGC